MQTNKEILQEGWLIKSPPTKRILRARWRRRWFTLKQGEIPGQFCLEYYTDRNCRKLKGVIDLDQCEQVDSGLRLEHRKQKFQFMFDIKTPRRTYYLAADTEIDMRDWVNCICQVCNLHESSNDRQYYNLLPVPNNNGKNDFQNDNMSSLNPNTASAVQKTPEKSMVDHTSRIQIQLDERNLIRELSIEEDLHHNNEMSYVNTEFMCKEAVTSEQDFINSNKNERSRPQTSNEKTGGSISFSQKPGEKNNSPKSDISLSNHSRSKGEQITTNVLSNSSGAVKKKIPDNLVLTDNVDDASTNIEPSPALSTSSGPYIPLSQCFSGSPKYFNNPTTPLNNLDPKFYETPRNSNINFGLNLTNDQSYSPKISNFAIPEKTKSGQSSPTDSESVFTDEDESTYRPSRNSDRKARPSDSSVENDLIVFSYDQRFSKFPDDVDAEGSRLDDGNKNINNLEETNPIQITQKQRNRLELQTQKLRDKNYSKDFPQFSDTENTSPAASAKNTSKWVADQRTQQYCNMNNAIAASTPNLYSENQCKTINLASAQSGTLPRSNPFMNVERSEENVFRYDFVEKGKSQTLNNDSILPPVNRELKPKLNFENKCTDSIQSKSTNTLHKIPVTDGFPIRPPSIDRTLKPAVKVAESPNRRSHVPIGSTIIPSEFSSNSGEIQTQTLPRISTGSGHYGNNNAIMNNNQGNAIYNNNNIFMQNHVSPGINVSGLSSSLHIPTNQMQKLEYCDLEIANGPCTNRTSIISTISQQSDTKSLPKSNTVYRSIDFEKTRVLNQIREDTQGRSRRKD